VIRATLVVAALGVLSAGCAHSSTVQPTELSVTPIPTVACPATVVTQSFTGLPVRVVAELVDSSAAIIEKHYGAAIASKMDDLVASAVVPLVGARKSA
jgi:hypothetical protein